MAQGIRRFFLLTFLCLLVAINLPQTAARSAIAANGNALPVSSSFATEEIAGLVDVFDLPPGATEIDLLESLAQDEAVGAVIEAIRLSVPPTNYGGLYVRWRDGDPTLHVGITTALPPLAISTAAQGSGIRVAHFLAANTLAELLQLTDDVATMAPYLEGVHGTSFETIVPQESWNKVLVGLNPYKSTAALDLEQRYGADNVYVYAREPLTPKATPRELAYPPMRSGLSIHIDYDGGNFYCTSGFVLEADVGSGNAVATAGHCGSGIPNSVLWRTGAHPNDILLGSVQFRRRSGNLDGAVIDTPDQTGSASASVYVVQNFMRQVAKVQNYAQAAEGRPVCMVGITSGPQCGQVIEVNATVKGGGLRLVKQLVADIGGQGGDSGGPFYRPLGDREALAQGIASTANQHFTSFSHIEFLENQSDYHVRLVRD